MSSVPTTEAPVHATDDALPRQIVDLHFHPRHGARFWLRRQQRLGFDVRDRVRSMADLRLFGMIEPEDLRGTSVWDFVPRAFHRQRDRFVLVESGGSSGAPVPGAYLQSEFHDAFVTPFVEVADLVGFPRGAQWLYIGPSGPHVIGRAARELALALDSPEPWQVDFDPRWAKKLAPGSLAAKRYLDHVVEQAIAVFRREPCEVLFTTPRVVERLIEVFTDTERERLRGLHLGGLAMTADDVNRFRQAFPAAAHLAGYGNTLFGCALEVADQQRTTLDYFPRGPRLQFDVMIPDGAEGKRGQLVFHRLDESMLLVGVLERDWGELIPASPPARELGWCGNGIRDPAPPPTRTAQLKLGIY